MKSGFRQIGDVLELGSDFENVCILFNELALGLLVNRNVAQMWSNEEIESHLRYVAKNQPLPWSFR